MVMDERRKRIVSFINEEGSVTFSQLKQEFSDVSEMTLRTDLKALDEQHLIIRVHGGAESVGFAVGTDDLLARRASRHSQEKVTIAQKAAKLVHSGRKGQARHFSRVLSTRQNSFRVFSSVVPCQISP